MCSKGAGTTAAGEPYLAKFPDSFGNICIHQVAWPAVISRYFHFSNQVDVHNQARQYDLALEKKWVTYDGWFRLYTTIIGMTLVDCWKIEKTRCRIKQKKSITSLEHVDQLGKEMIDTATTIKKSGKKKTCSGTEFYINTNKSYTSLGISEVSGNIETRRHTRCYLSHQLRFIWCSIVGLVERKTTMKCSECGN